MKPNIETATFLSIQIARNYIPRNLDAMSNMDSPVPNATLVSGYSSLSVNSDLSCTFCFINKISTIMQKKNKKLWSIWAKVFVLIMCFLCVVGFVWGFEAPSSL